jgi:hypothetical protein
MKCRISIGIFWQLCIAHCIARRLGKTSTVRMALVRVRVSRKDLMTQRKDKDRPVLSYEDEYRDAKVHISYTTPLAESHSLVNVHSSRPNHLRVAIHSVLSLLAYTLTL